MLGFSLLVDVPSGNKIEGKKCDIVRSISCYVDEEYHSNIASVIKCLARFTWLFSTRGKGTVSGLVLSMFSYHDGVVV